MSFQFFVIQLVCSLCSDSLQVQIIVCAEFLPLGIKHECQGYHSLASFSKFPFRVNHMLCRMSASIKHDLQGTGTIERSRRLKDWPDRIERAELTHSRRLRTNQSPFGCISIWNLFCVNTYIFIRRLPKSYIKANRGAY